MTALPLPGMALPESAASAPAPAAARRRYEFFVAGEPKPMGSKTAFVVKGKFGPRAVVTDGSTSKPAGKLMRAWKDSVIATALVEFSGDRIMGAVSVEMRFLLARPAGHRRPDGTVKKSAPRWPAVKPDADKLARSTLDALAVVMLADDSRVVELLIRKRYADEGPTGAHITVEEL